MRRRALATAICAAVAILGAGVQPAMAAGSGDLWPNLAPGNRANTEWRTDSYGNGVLTRRTLLKAYMTTGQFLLLGSSAIGQGSSDIRVYNPGLVTGPIGTETIPASPSFSCNTQRLGGPVGQGMITTRAQELAGPDTIPTSGSGGYLPCFYAAPSTGIYDIVFLGPAGATNTNGTVAADVALAQAGDFSASQGTSIAAWDATVRDSLALGVNSPGRVFTYYLALFTGGNGLPVFPTIYAVTNDAYKYQVDLRGMDPNGWLVYGNQVGFLDSDGSTPLYHDAVAFDDSKPPSNGFPGQLTTIQGGVKFARPSFPLFFEPPAAVTIAALGIPAAPIAPIMSAISFTGTLGGNTSLVNSGGTFKFTTNVPGVYDIVISRNGSFDPTLPVNRSLRGVVVGAGTHTVAWNGRDNSNVPFPAGPYNADVTLHGGEYHFPMIDVENDTTGGPTITMINPPGACPPLIGGCSGAFYDDRAYRTLSGKVVNSPGNAVGNTLCGLVPPVPAFADPINGFNSTTTQRKFGAAGGNPNTNVPCTGNFGDAKGLDIWTYNQSNTVLAPLKIVASADIRVTKTVSDSTPAVGTNVTFTVSARNLGPANATGVQVRDVLPAGVTLVSATPSRGTYDTGTGIWKIGNLANGVTVTLRITVTVNTTNRVTNTAVRIAGTPADFDPANNSASARVTGSTIPGLPNTGTPPVGTAAIALLGLLILVAVTARRRRVQR